MPTPPAAWSSVTLVDILDQVEDWAQYPNAAGWFTQLLFHALHAQGWDGCLVEKELSSQNGGHFSINFLRWRGQTMNLQKQTQDEVLADPSLPHPLTHHVERVLTAPDSEMVDLTHVLPRDYAHAKSVVESLLLDAAAHVPEALSRPPRL